jgi:hypothetical protein
MVLQNPHCFYGECTCCQAVSVGVVAPIEGAVTFTPDPLNNGCVSTPSNNSFGTFTLCKGVLSTFPPYHIADVQIECVDGEWVGWYCKPGQSTGYPPGNGWSSLEDLSIECPQSGVVWMRA